MKLQARLWVLPLCLLVAFGVAPVRAQDDEAEQRKKPLALYAEVGTWVAQAVGLEFEPASQIDLANPLNTQVLKMAHGTQGEARYRFGVDFGERAGGVLVTWYAHEDDEVGLRETRPNEFVFGQLLSVPFLAGFSNDGLADGFTSQAKSQLRDFRADYVRTAFRTDHVHGRWFVGVRRVQHSRELAATYFALEPLLPPLIPPFVQQPRPDLEPLPETAFVGSAFRGRGLEGGLEVEFSLLPNDKLLVEGGVALGVLRGKIDSTYRSTNAFYVIVDGATGEATMLEPPYSEFGETELVGGVPMPLVNRIMQNTESFGVRTQSRVSGAQVLEASLGLRWHAWRGLDVFAGFRSTFYDNVGVDLRVTEGSTSTVGQNLQVVTEVDRSVTYEGFYGGIGLRF